jgi:hypothetical protein
MGMDSYGKFSYNLFRQRWAIVVYAIPGRIVAPEINEVSRNRRGCGSGFLDLIAKPCFVRYVRPKRISVFKVSEDVYKFLFIKCIRHRIVVHDRSSGCLPLIWAKHRFIDHCGRYFAWECRLKAILHYYWLTYIYGSVSGRGLPQILESKGDPPSVRNSNWFGIFCIHHVWPICKQQRLVCNIICISGLLYLLSGVIGVKAQDYHPYGTNQEHSNLLWGPMVLAAGVVGIIHGWYWFWGIMGQKWTSPLKAFIIGTLSIILGFVALSWGLHHTDPVLSFNNDAPKRMEPFDRTDQAAKLIVANIS